MKILDKARKFASRLSSDDSDQPNLSSLRRFLSPEWILKYLHTGNKANKEHKRLDGEEEDGGCLTKNDTTEEKTQHKKAITC